MTTIQEHPSGRVLLLRWSGPLDGSTPVHSAVSAHALRSRARFLIIDTTHAPYADSDGLRWLLRLHSLAEACGKRLRIAADPHGKVWRNLSLLQAGLDVYESVAAAWHVPWSDTGRHAPERGHPAAGH